MFLLQCLLLYIKYFNKLKNEIIIASADQYDVQDLLKSSSLMITDYSSVFFDMVYMKKPIIFYQFDEEKFRKYHYSEGYFDYHNNQFGKSFCRQKDLFANLEYYVKQNFKISIRFDNEHKKLFKYYDKHNSERIYNILKHDKL